MIVHSTIRYACIWVPTCAALRTWRFAPGECQTIDYLLLCTQMVVMVRARSIDSPLGSRLSVRT